MKKYLSRKFILSAAAFLGSIGTSIAALNTGNQILAGIGLFCAIISAAMYAAAEAAVDAAASRLKSDGCVSIEKVDEEVQSDDKQLGEE